ncbi:methionine ABC transporter permease [Variovorax sp. J22G73]|jgi:D-methionine transport system permease protein|uniref:methionine ABC transporter permease n=1 Tax=unclassified Variovorax TaxID=663243 RepID=UPI002575E0CB|nr:MULTISPECIES: methionine ABC transporter permease [unclassified Variovorax]MDM0008140.1 methionine ABC transporter permease [Variovorax sp. J22R203]MDM0100646.1 methionine ABC transporter permease [Variovorax sp. J22G73]
MALLDLFIAAIGETLTMVSVSALIVLFIGLPLAVLLVTTAPGGIYEAARLNRVLGAVINMFRSTPFIILMVALIPFTRLVVGTTIGVWAAAVPLTVASAPFFARVSEVSLRSVDKGLVEAAQAMGCHRRDIVRHVLLPEALPGLIAGFTLTVVAMIGSSAMAGALGAGGLGDLAIRYGYQRFDTSVMLMVIVLLILLVSLVQFVGESLARRLTR